MTTPRTARTRLGLAVLAVVPVLAGVLTPVSATAAPEDRMGWPGGAKRATSTGYGGGVATVDHDATKAGIEALARGGTAVDAAVAAAAALGVTEAYSAGIGGGGFFVYYDARTKQVHTIDGRETAPAAMGPNSFVDPKTGKVLPFDQAVTSGLSVGVPGTPATWDRALRKWGRLDLRQNLRPAIEIARKGFVVDEEFRGQTALNEKRFRAFPATAELYLPGGKLPEVGSKLKNPDLADTYEQLGRKGVDWLYKGELGRDVARTSEKPPVDPAAGLTVPAGLMKPADLAAYEVEERKPTKIGYRGLDVYSMAPPSSGGTTVGEALNILENYRLSGKTPKDEAEALHLYLEATRLAYADRNKWVGDPGFVNVPVQGLLSDEFAKQRACAIKQDKTMGHPAVAGDPTKIVPGQPCATPMPAAPMTYEGPSTTHLVTADRWGNVVSYTLTIEQTGGSGITVPKRGFLLNNELTDFDIEPPAAGKPLPANAPAAGKRPRSSMSPTIVLKNGKPLLAVGSPGGSTIITTVLQTLVNRLDLGKSLPEAVLAPRISQRNAAKTEAEKGFMDGRLRSLLEAKGHQFTLAPTTFAPNPEIGTVAALEFLGNGRIQFAAEPSRRGGGSALALIPIR
ncbi:gamma-glutamyltransferase [Allokutzneria multivorans]|uniref:Glutathione hydrolase proenzyme n=1 Tax=Allokutzneria multivorans TaxID=1142134 RepID=A0ABP7STA7_9PSEU